MITASEYCGINSSTPFSGMDREMLVYELINQMDSELVRIGEHANPMTLAVKRRFRNEVMRDATVLAKDRDTTPDDWDCIVDAFFSTKLGGKIESRQSLWQETGSARANLIKKLARHHDTRGFLISPYDPRFAESGVFANNKDVVGFCRDDNNPDAPIEYIAFAKEGGSYDKTIRDEYMTANVEEFVLADLAYVTGFNYIKQFAKDKHALDGLEDFFMSTDDNNIPLRNIDPKQAQFMKDACKFLSENGIPFNVEVENAKLGRVRAKLAGGAEIRLMDLEDPQYLGRIYDHGRVIRVSIQRGPNSKSERTAPLEMNMNMLRWYFGTAPVPTTEYNLIEDANGEHFEKVSGGRTFGIGAGRQVGAFAKLVNPAGAVIEKNSSNINQQAAFLTASGNDGGKSGDSTVTLGLVNTMTQSSDGKYVRKLYPVSISVSSSSSSSSQTMFSDRFDNEIMGIISPLTRPHENSEAWRAFSAALARTGLVADNEYIKKAEANGRVYRVIDPSLPQERLDELKSYIPVYNKIKARRTLEDWFESAKDHHAELMGFDKLAEDYNLWLADRNHKPVFTDDEECGALAGIYWDVLTGVEPVSAIEDHANLNVDQSAFNAMTPDERVNHIIKSYEGWAEKAFGELPDITLYDGVKPDNTGKGFDASRVAKYAVSEGSAGIQSNLSAMKRMLMLMGDDFDNDWIIGDNYNNTSMKNSLIRFNPDKKIAKISLSAMMNEYGALRHMTIVRGLSFENVDAYIAQNLEERRRAYNERHSRWLAQGGASSGKPEPKEPKGLEFAGTDGVDGEAGRVQFIDKDILEDELDAMGAGRLKDMPVTTDMMVHAMRALMTSGCVIGVPRSDASIKKAEVKKLVDSGMDAVQAENYVNANINTLRDQYKRDITIEVDENGIMHYEAYQQQGKSDSIKPHEWKVEGTIGQIFEPDERGVIDPRYAVPNNKVLIPGYSAYLVDPDPNKPETVADRLRLVGWQQQMKQAITQQMRRAAMTLPSEYNFTPHGADLNKVYAHEYGMTMRREDYYERLPKDMNNLTIEEKTFLDVIEASLGRIKFSNEFEDGTSTAMQAYLEHPDEFASQIANYRYSDLNDNHNIRVLGRWYDGIFDPTMTGTARNQGTVRFLAQGVKVDNRTGRVMRITNFDKDNPPECVLMKNPLLRNIRHDSWDRNMMTINQMLTAFHVTDSAKMAMMTCKGFTFDDGFVISKKFAEKHAIRSIAGDYRPLIVQDKLADCHGNKGVITCVADPDMHSDAISEFLLNNNVELADGGSIVDYNGKSVEVSIEPESDIPREKQAALQIQDALGFGGLDDLLQAFRDNPDLDIIASPYSGMSRANAGSIVDLMENPSDLIVRDENGNTFVREGGMGTTGIIVVDMPADAKTHINDEEAILEGKGRKASGQLAWALQAKGASMVMQELFGGNAKAFDDLREYAIACGLDLNERMEPVIGYHAQKHANEKRKLLKLPNGDEFELNNLEFNTGKGKKTQLDASGAKLVNDMQDMLAVSGGFMELPFQLDFKTLSYAGNSMPFKDSVPDDMFLLKPTGQKWLDADGLMHDSYALPVLSQNLRSGCEMQDGTTSAHDYTTAYTAIYRNAMLWMKADEAQRKGGENAKLAHDYKQNLEEMSQAKLDYIVSDIMQRRISDKHGVVRNGIMMNRLAKSATAVLSADPRNDSDEVKMPSSMALKLGIADKDENGIIKLKRDARVLLWRDPVLKDGNLRYLRVGLDDRLTGVSINPIMDKSYDADFDGDSVGVAVLNNPDAKREAFMTFSVEANLLQHGNLKTISNPDYEEELAQWLAEKEAAEDAGIDFNMPEPEREMQGHPLYIQSGLDRSAAEYDNPEIAHGFAALEYKINKLEEKVNNKYYPIETIKTNVVYMRADGSSYEKTETGWGAINAIRSSYKHELDALIHASLDHVGKDMIRFKDDRSICESFQRIIDDKAKGNISKFSDLADNMGIDFNIDENGRIDPESIVVMVDKDGRRQPKSILDCTYRDVCCAIQETAAYKADDTSLGGMCAQRVTVAFRDEILAPVLELTYPVTQSILQSKKSPKDAKIKDEILRFWGRYAMDGFKLTGDWKRKDGESDDDYIKRMQEEPHLRIQEPAKDANGNIIYKTGRSGRQITDKNGSPVPEMVYQKCTADEWYDQMVGMYSALKVIDDMNPSYISDVADKMRGWSNGVPAVKANSNKVLMYVDENGEERVARTGGRDTVMGIEMFGSIHGSLLDRVAYSEKASAFIQAAVMNSVKEYHDKYVAAYDINAKEDISSRNRSMAGTAPDEAMNIVKADYEYKKARANAIQARNSGDEALSKKAGRDLANARDRRINAFSEVSNSGTFATRETLTKIAMADYFDRTGGNPDPGSPEYDIYCRQQSIKNGELRSSDITVRADGHKSCMLINQTLGGDDRAMSYMGESQDEYAKRCSIEDKIKGDAPNIVDLNAYAIAQQLAQSNPGRTTGREYMDQYGNVLPEVNNEIRFA